MGGRLLPSLRESRSLLSPFLSLKSPFQGVKGRRKGCAIFQQLARQLRAVPGGAGERCRTTMLPRPPSFWRQNHAKPWPAGRQHPWLSWGGAGMFSRCKTVCRGISVALLPPIQLGRQRWGGMPRSPPQTEKMDQQARCQVLCHQPLALWYPRLSDAEASRGTWVLPCKLILRGSLLGCRKMILAI